MMSHSSDSQRLNRPIWYAAYGSNLSSARFRTYLEGGRVPHTPGGHIQQGARDPSLPTGNGPCEINRAIGFAGSSDRWGGGGVAFLYPADDSDNSAGYSAGDAPLDFPTLGRAWRITLGQFEDLFRQENRLEELMEIDLEEVANTGSLDMLADRYGRIELLEMRDGDPILTFTRPQPPEELNKAHISYLRAIADGLIETWMIEPEDTARYLAALPGNAGAWETDKLIVEIMSND